MPLIWYFYFGGIFMFIDTHCHLSIEDYDDIDKVVKEDIEAGVKGMSVPTLCRIAKVLRLSTDYILWGKSGQENPDSVMMVLENCTERERSYAEQLLKIFVVAMNGSDN